jgi:hypothetical protein
VKTFKIYTSYVFNNKSYSIIRTAEIRLIDSIETRRVVIRAWELSGGRYYGEDLLISMGMHWVRAITSNIL